jgi:hypothetical protein
MSEAQDKPAARRYPGVDAHLNSFLQQPDGGWESFHAEHIVQIRYALDAVLPAAYYAIAEKSLQIAEIGLDDVRVQRVRPDVSIYQRGPSRSGSAAVLERVPELTASDTTTEIELASLLRPDDDLTAVNIYQVTRGRAPGTLVTRIELLSPANKSGAELDAYQIRRLQTLLSGVALVEIDLLHETRPVINALPDYRAGEPGSSPYYVMVTLPYPHYEAGRIRVWAVGVDQPLPRISVPLGADRAVVVDLQVVYHRTVDGARVFPLLADYDQPAVNLDRYHPDDQTRLREIMAAWQTPPAPEAPSDPPPVNPAE